MLTNIRLRNFKSFSDTGGVEMAPLTVLTGPNSSGKSAIIRAMMALRQTVESRDHSTAFVPTGEYVDLGSYEDFVFKRDTKSSVGIDIVSKLSRHGTFFGIEMRSTQNQEMSLSLELAYLASIDRIYLKQSTVDFNQGEIQIRKKTMKSKQIGRSYRTSVSLLGDESVDLPNSGRAKFHAVPPDTHEFNDLEKRRKRFSQREGEKVVATQFAKMVEECVLRELANLRYIGPLRESPRRMYLSTGETPREVGIAGELGPAVLWSASKARQLDSVTLSEWCKRMGLALEIKLAPVRGGFFRILIVDMHTGVAVSLSDVGVGTSQLLPILIQGLIAPTGATLLLEQPEIHLHPRAQAYLADFLIDVNQRDVGVIVETHSEHLITRLQRRIAEETLKPDDVALYYVTPSPKGSTLERVNIDKYGRIPAAPNGFFEEGFEETFDLMKAVGQRRRRESDAGDGD